VAIMKELKYFISAVIFWVAFFMFGHWAIQNNLKWLVFGYSSALLIAYSVWMLKEAKYHLQFKKIKGIIKFLMYVALSASWVIFAWTLYEVYLWK
jgi:hypothetical protein